MLAIPQLQLALDFVSLPSALAVAVKVAEEVDVIEIGTPLCKAAGLEAIRAVREVCPDNLILADVGGLEASMAFDGGAAMYRPALLLTGRSSPSVLASAAWDWC